ncbi:unnamed protein product [Urochloa humidicola]
MGMRSATRRQGGWPPLEVVRKQPSRAAADGQTDNLHTRRAQPSGKVMGKWCPTNVRELTQIVNHSVGNTDYNGLIELPMKFMPLMDPYANSINYHVSNYPSNSASVVCLVFV